MKLHVAALIIVVSTMSVLAQNQAPQLDRGTVPAIKKESNVVLVPALVTTKAGEVVFSLKSQDFTVLDNGVPQKLALDDDIKQRPLALAIVVQTGGVASRQLPNLRHLETMIEAMVENVPHEVALVAFDSQPHLLQTFTPSLTQIATSMQAVRAGDRGAGLLDALVFSLNLVKKQPPEFRRAVLLISEAVDHGSTARLNEAIRDVSETNTAIYSMTFSSSKAQAEAAVANKTRPPCPTKERQLLPGGTQSCISFTPLIALGARVGMAGLSRNTPATIARLSGGEYMQFEDEKSLESGLSTIANQLPNRYMLSFVPSSPIPGLHTIQVTLKEYPQLHVSARTSYWVANEATGGTRP